MLTSIQGYPRIGSSRELKRETESFFAGKAVESQLLGLGATLRARHWAEIARSGLDLIPSNDFSHYDATLDAAILLGAVPARYRELGLGKLGTMFAMARGYQGRGGDAKALPMRKWFNTNYHYIAPELEEGTALALSGTKPFDEYLEARALGVETKPTLIGPFTFLALALTGDGRNALSGRDAERRASEAASAYGEILARLDALGARWVSFEEPALALDLSPRELSAFSGIYRAVLASRGSARVILQTSFGDVGDAYREACSLPFDAIGLDFVEGPRNLELVDRWGFPEDKILIAGIVNGKNVWKNDYDKSVATLRWLSRSPSGPRAESIALGTSCSLLHVPYALEGEDSLPTGLKERLAFAREKLHELAELRDIATRALTEPSAESADPRARLPEPIPIPIEAGARSPNAATRARIQRERLALPAIPATTIGSFPQTGELKELRSRYRKGEVSWREYRDGVRDLIRACVAFQERVGLDVLVHGEFERVDMVEYFGENLEGFAFTARGWVQSYGTRCVKPPIIHGDVSRRGPITVEWASFAQSLTKRPVKGMLTGPVTILNWSFPREDVPLAESAFQIARAIRDETLDLERAGIRVIQIDEAALREKLPLRERDRDAGYLDWAIPAFRLSHAGVRPETQIHTHMCYSDFAGIVTAIDAMDADVISFEAARSSQSILASIAGDALRAALGPGVYDIHSPRVPTVKEIGDAILRALERIPADRLWINPDCGLKTRDVAETERSLANMMDAAREARALLAPKTAAPDRLPKEQS